MQSSFDKTIWGGYRWDVLTNQRLQNKLCLEQYGYKSYSQNDEDGIIEEIFRRIGCRNRVFVEFGVEDGIESNGHLLLHKGWSGLWIEGNRTCCEKIRYKFRPVIEEGRLQAVHAFITKDNIDRLITSAGISGEIDLLSIDVDGNDYYIWEAIHSIDPAAVVIEYNGKFPPDVDWKMAYNRNHIWAGTDWHGASLKALELLGAEKGYQLVGTNLNGANAFFVKQTLAGDKFYKPAAAEALYNPLRLNLVHKNGHPSAVCLCGQSSNQGIFDYDSDAYAVFGYGFHSTEYDGSGRKFAWSSQTECTILLNRKKCKGGGTVVIPYSSCIRDGILRACFEQGQTAAECLVEQEGTIEMPLPDDTAADTDTGAQRLVLQTSKLFVPFEEGINEDRRHLGIAVFIEEIHMKTVEDRTAANKQNVLIPSKNLEELFRKMETCVKNYETIFIKNPYKKRNIEMCVNAFIEKYKALVSNVSRSYEGECITQIRLKVRETDRTGHYIDIRDEYDEEYYLNDCGGYVEFEKFGGQSLDYRLANMMYFIEPENGDKILDIGCGRGELTYMLSKYASKTVGIDYSKAAVEIAVQKFGSYMEAQNLQYLCEDVMQLSPEEKYNKIVMADVYEHIEAEVMEQLLQKIACLLTEDGMLFIHTAPNLDYYEKVYAKQVQAANLRNAFLPANPRSRYEERMHINEQRPLSLKQTLRKYFSDVYVWSGGIESEEQLMDLDRQKTENEITAAAGKHIDRAGLLKRISNGRLERENVRVQMSCKTDCIASDGKETLLIPVEIKNEGKEPLKSQMPYPVFLSYHITGKNGESVVYDGLRSVLKTVIHPGMCSEEFLEVSVQGLTQGEYWIEADIVQEGWLWFSDVCDMGVRIRLTL